MEPDGAARRRPRVAAQVAIARRRTPPGPAKPFQAHKVCLRGHHATQGAAPSGGGASRSLSIVVAATESECPTAPARRDLRNCVGRTCGHGRSVGRGVTPACPRGGARKPCLGHRALRRSGPARLRATQDRRNRVSRSQDVRTSRREGSLSPARASVRSASPRICGDGRHRRAGRLELREPRRQRRGLRVESFLRDRDRRELARQSAGDGW